MNARCGHNKIYIACHKLTGNKMNLGKSRVQTFSKAFQGQVFYKDVNCSESLDVGCWYVQPMSIVALGDREKEKRGPCVRVSLSMCPMLF